MINTIDDAIRVCNNDVRLVGTLTELTITITKRDISDVVVVSYYGVVRVEDTFLKFYGSFNNNNAEFYRNVNKLKALNAHIMCVIDESGYRNVTFNDVATKVYMIGRLLNEGKLKCTYVSTTSSKIDYIKFDVCGAYIDYDGLCLKLLIITNNYHNLLTIPIATDIEISAENKIVSLCLETVPYIDTDVEPIICTSVGILNEEVNQSVIQTALAEHELFIDSIEGVKSK